MNRIVHFKKDDKFCACGAEIEWFAPQHLTTKHSDVTCSDCLNEIHLDFKFRVTWKENECFIRVFKGHKKVGGGKIFCSKSMISFISDVFVLPQYRRLGLAARVVRELVRRNGLPVSLQAIPYRACPRDNPPDRETLFKFYEKLGFVKTGIMSNMICVPPLAMYIIRTVQDNVAGYPSYVASVKDHGEISVRENTEDKAIISLIKNNKEFFGLELASVL